MTDREADIGESRDCQTPDVGRDRAKDKNLRNSQPAKPDA